jgi:short-subunit dehydrogenase
MSTVTKEVIWITGASSGIGKSIALKLAQQGNRVIISARNKQALDDLAQSNENLIPLVFDVTDNANTDSIREQIQTYTPYLDRVILNAGSCEYLEPDNIDWSMMQRIMTTNYFGAVNTLAAAMPLLQSAPSGNPHIIGVASLVTVAAFPKAGAYGASKAAMQYLLDSLREDLKPQNINVTVINPGFIETPLTNKNNFSMPFIISADEAGERIVKAIVNKPRQYDFPKRMKWTMKIVSSIPWVWNKVVRVSNFDG